MGERSPAQPASGLYTTFIGDHPNDANPGYHEDVQGVAHGQDHWFITQSDGDDPDPRERSIWKIPVTENLASVSTANPNVQIALLDNISALAGYNHFGDPEHYLYKDSGYLLVPVEGPGVVPVLAVFRSTDLGFVGMTPLYHSSAGWLAVDPEGFIYSSDNPADRLYKYTLEWDRLADNVVTIYLIGEIQLTNEDGRTLTLQYPQGGVFSEGGRYLYLVSGYYTARMPNDGIAVIDTQNWRRIAQSENGAGQFNFEFDPGEWPGEAEEPEGITVWDLENGRAPGVSGKLHVFKLDNDADDDEIWFKHYR